MSLFLLWWSAGIAWAMWKLKTKGLPKESPDLEACIAMGAPGIAGVAILLFAFLALLGPVAPAWDGWQLARRRWDDYRYDRQLAEINEQINEQRIRAETWLHVRWARRCRAGCPSSRRLSRAQRGRVTWLHRAGCPCLACLSIETNRARRYFVLRRRSRHLDRLLAWVWR